IDKPVAAFSIPTDRLCEGNSITVSNQSNAPGSTVASWYWNFGNGSISTQRQPTVTYDTKGNFIIKLSVVNAEGCVSDTATQTIQVFGQPVIDAGPSFVVKEGMQVTFSATSNDSTFTFLWSPATGLNNPNILQPTLQASSDMVYTLTATGENNCTASDQLTVSVQKGIFIPNAFTPNGDGLNDTWNIKYIDLYPESSIVVYDRYGGVVFKGNGLSRPWDGKKQGKDLPVGAYPYIIDLRDGTPIERGVLTILR
nr:gliding motility-associated C-terminal domain-containing protein [Chitinophagaceae bacterium]